MVSRNNKRTKKPAPKTPPVSEEEFLRRLRAQKPKPLGISKYIFPDINGTPSDSDSAPLECDDDRNASGKSSLFVTPATPPQSSTSSNAVADSQEQQISPKVESPKEGNCEIPELSELPSREEADRLFEYTKSEEYVKREIDVLKKELGSTLSELETTTPDLTKRQAKEDLKQSFSDQNLDSNLSSYVDSMFGVEPYKYVRDHQPLVLFWLLNTVVSGLMKIPSLAALSSHCVTSELLYMVFTDESIDIIQDVSSLNIVKPREGYTPFVVIYSYNLKSMYFKVVKETGADVNMVSFNKNATNMKDCLCYHSEKTPGSSHSNPVEPSYEFYRSFLYGKDDASDRSRLRVFVHPSNKTSFDMRYLSVNSDKRDLSVKSNSTPMNEALNGILTQMEKEEQEQQSGTDSTESPFSHACQNAELDLPDELFEECKLLVGMADVDKSVGHPDSVANYRTESVIKKNFKVYLGDVGEEEISKQQMEGMIKVRDGGSVIYRSGELELYEGQKLKVEFPTIYSRHFEHDDVTVYSDSILKSCFNFIKSLLPEDCLDININKLAQFCPNIFWNLALTGDIETSIIELDPEILRSLYKRKKRANTDTDTYSRPKRQKSLDYLDNNFIIMQNLFKRDADEKIKKLKSNQKRNGNGGRMSRVVTSKHMEDDELLKILMDENGFTRKSMRVLTDKQKNLVYKECMNRNFHFPVNIKFNPRKGRGVYAAHQIHKDDFLMEYKGELVTEKVAKYRSNKYSNSGKYKGSFIFFFKHNGRRYGIDATEEDISFGPARLVNHSKRNANVVVKTINGDNYPRLIFVAKRDIESGEELLVDYGERDPSVIKENPWLMD